VRFKVELKSQSSTTAFKGFAALNSWVISDRPYDFRWGRNATARDYDRGVAITLNFDFDVRDVTLEELHIEVTQLVFATLSLSLETTSCVQIRSGGTTKPVARAYSTLYRLRRVLLIFFADMIHTKPRQKDTMRTPSTNLLDMISTHYGGICRTTTQRRKTREMKHCTVLQRFLHDSQSNVPTQRWICSQE
jgi:hypothetical protein